MLKKLLLISIMFIVCIQAFALDDQGDPNDPTINERANNCYEDGTMAGKCDTEWEWNCGWHMIRFDYGIFSREQIPSFCASLLPALPEIEIGPFTAGCYGTPITGLGDIFYNGSINQVDNIQIFQENSGCNPAQYIRDLTLVYFVGTSADAFSFCQTLDPAMASISNLRSGGYPVPDEFYWLCGD